MNTSMQAKNKKSGSTSGDLELVFDADLQQYVIRKVDNGQTSVFDDDSYECVDDNGIQLLPASTDTTQELPVILSENPDEYEEATYEEIPEDEEIDDCPKEDDEDYPYEDIEE